MLAPGVEHVAGAGLDDDGEAVPVELPGDRGGPTGEVRRERVEMHVVEGQRDPVVAEVGEQGERVGQPEVDQPVGAIAEPQSAGPDGAGPVPVGAHVGLTRRDSRRATGHSVASPAASRGAPPRASSAASSGISPSTPVPTAC